MSRSLDVSDGGPAFEGLTFATVKSRSLRGRADVTLFVPPEAKSRHDVPLIILLHGAYGSHWNWAVNGGAHRTAKRLMAAGRIPPVVLAMPSDGLWGDGSGYLIHKELDFEKWITEDVPAAARTAATCLSAQSPVFLCGLSMGGYGALRIGAKYAERYRGLAAHSAITHFKQLMKYVEEDPGSYGAPADDHSVFDTMLRHRAALPPFRFDCGIKDGLLRFNRKLHQDLEAAGIAHRYFEFPGGHDWNYWSEHLEDSLSFFGEILGSQNKL